MRPEIEVALGCVIAVPSAGSDACHMGVDFVLRLADSTIPVTLSDPWGVDAPPVERHL